MWVFKDGVSARKWQHSWMAKERLASDWRLSKTIDLNFKTDNLDTLSQSYPAGAYCTGCVSSAETYRSLDLIYAAPIICRRRVMGMFKYQNIKKIKGNI